MRAPSAVLRRSTRSLAGACSLLASLVSACAKAPPAPSAPSASAPAARSAPAPAASSSPAPLPSAAASIAAPPAPPAAAPDPLLADSGAPLPQTDARPSASSDSFRERMQLVVEAIARDAPELALPAFFPLVAYRQVKAIERPDRDWKQRLIGAFERDVREYHRALGADAASAVLNGVDVTEERVKWMQPGKEGNKVGYYRVLRSKLRVGLSGGRERALEITSLISWRGEWYVVHLSGFD